MVKIFYLVSSIFDILTKMFFFPGSLKFYIKTQNG